MKKVMVVACGSYMDSGYGCPGEWRCLKAAALGDGAFGEESQIISMVKCQCPGRSTVANIGMAMKLADMKPDAIFLSSCMAKAKPDCPYSTVDEKVSMIEAKTGIKVVLGTHDYV